MFTQPPRPLHEGGFASFSCGRVHPSLERRGIGIPPPILSHVLKPATTYLPREDFSTLACCYTLPVLRAELQTNSSRPPRALAAAVACVAAAMLLFEVVVTR